MTLKLSCSGIALLLASTTGAWAQDAPKDAAKDAAQHHDEIIVNGFQTQPLDQPAAIAKTGTPLGNLPRSIEIVPRDLLDQQGATRLTDALSNVSGVAQGGQFAFGFFDRVIIRGLNASYLTDGLPDEVSELTGIPHSLTGVQQIEVIKGPGSALYGTSAQGGMINIVHARPSDAFTAGGSVQYGSFNTLTTDAWIAGATGLPNVDYRIDGSYINSDGFRGVRRRFIEAMPALSWRPANHDIEARVEIRSIEMRPDSAGIPFAPPAGIGLPASVPVDNVYYSPFARGNQDIQRVLLSDAWTLSDSITINNRLSFTHRDVDILRNAGGTVALLGAVYGLRNRTIRRQNDDIDDFLYQLEPQFTFSTGGIKHTLLTGFQVESIDGHVSRATATLPNIASIDTPVIPETSEASLTFLCDAAHSCAEADISARFYSLYATDQIDLSDAFKLRLSARNDWDETRGVATANIPVNPGMSQPCSPPQVALCQWVQGVPVQRNDSLFSWDVGAVYFIVPQFSLFIGAQNSRYPIFNTEEPESIGSVPETGTQYEAGARLAIGDKLTWTVSGFEVHRDSVFTTLIDTVTGLDVPTIFSYRVRGWESDLNARPLKNWNIIANISWNEPIITSFPTATGDVGLLVPSVPKWLANFWTGYDIPLPGFGSMNLNFAVHYRGASFADAANTRILPGATLVNTGIGLTHGPLQLSFGVDNIFDRANWLGGAGTGGAAIPGPGRTYYGRVGIKF